MLNFGQMIADSAFLVLVNGSLVPAAEVEMATSVLRSSSAQCIERKHDLASLTPKDSFVSAKPVERIAWQIGETQKATREVGAGIGRIWRGAGCAPTPAC